MIAINDADIRILGMDGTDGDAGQHGGGGLADSALDGQPGRCAPHAGSVRASANGGPGHNGADGVPGTPAGGGGAAPDFHLEVDTIRGALVIVSLGGGGGRGGKGGAGGNGGSGGSAGQMSGPWAGYCLDGGTPRCRCAAGGRGGSGGDGGDGGHGGNGGNGGAIILEYSRAGQILPASYGGSGGLAGSGGTHGAGGPGGSDERVPDWPVSSAARGRSGEPGTAARDGLPGSGGAIVVLSRD